MPLERRLKKLRTNCGEKLPLAKHREKIKKISAQRLPLGGFLSKNPNLLTFFVDLEANFAAPKKTKNPVTIEITGFFLVGVARLELAASWSRTMRATICATPRCSFFIIMITHTVVKYQFSFYREICEICRFLFSEEMFLSVIFILTAFRNPTIIKPLRSALSCKLC